jgi:hypothetical protein
LYWVIRAVDEQRWLGMIGLLYSPHPLWSYHTFLQSIFVIRAQDLGSSFLGVTWSLAIEEQFYLIAPWLILALNRRVATVVCLITVAFCPFVRGALFLATHNVLLPFHAIFAHADSLSAGVLVALGFDGGAAPFSRRGAVSCGRSGRSSSPTAISRRRRKRRPTPSGPSPASGASRKRRWTSAPTARPASEPPASPAPLRC